MNTNSPDISVITVVFNAEKNIERTICSILNQTASNFEYIIIDGASTDNTLKIIEKYKTKLAALISEADNGLYDAMNKALSIAKGSFVWFINAGDEIAGNHVIESIGKYLNNDIIYSDTIVINENAEEIGLLSELTHNNAPENLTWKDMKRGMVVCHQSFIVRKEIAPQFDLKYKLSSDIDWVIKCLKNAVRITKTEFPLAKFMRAGLSKQKLNSAMKERYFILQKHFGFVPNLINHFFLLYRYIVSGRKSKVS